MKEYYEDIETARSTQETVLKFHAQAKRWIAYTVLTGSLAVVAVTGILVGLYLTGNLDRSKSKEKGSQSDIPNYGTDALQGSKVNDKSDPRRMDGSLSPMDIVLPPSVNPVKDHIQKSLKGLTNQIPKGHLSQFEGKDILKVEKVSKTTKLPLTTDNTVTVSVNNNMIQKDTSLEKQKVIIRVVIKDKPTTTENTHEKRGQHQLSDSGSNDISHDEHETFESSFDSETSDISYSSETSERSHSSETSDRSHSSETRLGENYSNGFDQTSKESDSSEEIAQKDDISNNSETSDYSHSSEQSSEENTSKGSDDSQTSSTISSETLEENDSDSSDKQTQTNKKIVSDDSHISNKNLSIRENDSSTKSDTSDSSESNEDDKHNDISVNSEISNDSSSQETSDHSKLIDKSAVENNENIFDHYETSDESSSSKELMQSNDDFETSRTSKLLDKSAEESSEDVLNDSESSDSTTSSHKRKEENSDDVFNNSETSDKSEYSNESTDKDSDNVTDVFEKLQDGTSSDEHSLKEDEVSDISKSLEDSIYLDKKQNIIDVNSMETSSEESETLKQSESDGDSSENIKKEVSESDDDSSENIKKEVSESDDDSSENIKKEVSKSESTELFNEDETLDPEAEDKNKVELENNKDDTGVSNEETAFDDSVSTVSEINLDDNLSSINAAEIKTSLQDTFGDESYDKGSQSDVKNSGVKLKKSTELNEYDSDTLFENINYKNKDNNWTVKLEDNRQTLHGYDSSDSKLDERRPSEGETESYEMESRSEDGIDSSGEHYDSSSNSDEAKTSKDNYVKDENKSKTEYFRRSETNNSTSDIDKDGIEISNNMENNTPEDSREKLNGRDQKSDESQNGEDSGNDKIPNHKGLILDPTKGKIVKKAVCCGNNENEEKTVDNSEEGNNAINDNKPIETRTHNTHLSHHENSKNDDDDDDSNSSDGKDHSDISDSESSNRDNTFEDKIESRDDDISSIVSDENDNSDESDKSDVKNSDKSSNKEEEEKDSKIDTSDSTSMDSINDNNDANSGNEDRTDDGNDSKNSVYNKEENSEESEPASIGLMGLVSQLQNINAVSDGGSIDMLPNGFAISGDANIDRDIDETGFLEKLLGVDLLPQATASINVNYLATPLPNSTIKEPDDSDETNEDNMTTSSANDVDFKGDQTNQFALNDNFNGQRNVVDTFSNTLSLSLDESEPYIGQDTAIEDLNIERLGTDADKNLGENVKSDDGDTKDENMNKSFEPNGKNYINDLKNEDTHSVELESINDEKKTSDKYSSEESSENARGESGETSSDSLNQRLSDDTKSSEESDEISNGDKQIESDSNEKTDGSKSDSNTRTRIINSKKDAKYLDNHDKNIAIIARSSSNSHNTDTQGNRAMENVEGSKINNVKLNVQVDSNFKGPLPNLNGDKISSQSSFETGSFIGLSHDVGKMGPSKRLRLLGSAMAVNRMKKMSTNTKNLVDDDHPSTTKNLQIFSKIPTTSRRISSNFHGNSMMFSRLLGLDLTNLHGSTQSHLGGSEFTHGLLQHHPMNILTTKAPSMVVRDKEQNMAVMPNHAAFLDHQHNHDHNFHNHDHQFHSHDHQFLNPEHIQPSMAMHTTMNPWMNWD